MELNRGDNMSLIFNMKEIQNRINHSKIWNTQVILRDEIEKKARDNPRLDTRRVYKELSSAFANLISYPYLKEFDYIVYIQERYYK